MSIHRICLLLAAAAGPATAQSGPPLRYVMLVNNGTISGEQTVEHLPNGLTKVHYVYKHNNSHTELDEQYRLAPDGTFSEYHVTGISEYGAPVDERFTRTGSRALWKSASESGEKTVSGTALYVPLNGSFQPDSVAITSLAARPEGKLALLPSGTLTQKKLDDVEVNGPDGRQRVALLAVKGLGLSPSFYWATTGGHPRLNSALTRSAQENLWHRRSSPQA